MSVHGDHRAGNGLRARPTIYNGTHMRSRLEASYAAYLDSAEVPWQYEPVAFASAEGQYLPDFYLPARMLMTLDQPARDVYVEVKPSKEAGMAAIRDRMPIVWASRPDAVLVVATPTHHAFITRELRADGKIGCGADWAILAGQSWLVGLARPWRGWS